MREMAVVGGVLGAGCVIVFALAAAVWMVFPTGATVRGGPWGGGVLMDRSMPVPMPGVDQVILEIPADGAEK
jgi:hypothetical protein